jgi:hypothetical protein
MLGFHLDVQASGEVGGGRLSVHFEVDPDRDLRGGPIDSASLAH